MLITENRNIIFIAFLARFFVFLALFLKQSPQFSAIPFQRFSTKKMFSISQYARKQQFSKTADARNI